MSKTLDVSPADRKLWEEIGRGDHDAWRECTERLEDKLTAFARARLSSSLRVRVGEEDIVQDTLVGLYKMALSSKPLNTSLNSLAMRVAQHCIIHHLEHHGAQKRSYKCEAGNTYAGDAEGLSPFIDQKPSIPDTVTEKMDIEVFLTGLTPLHRKILRLRLAQNSTKEIAAQLGSYPRSVTRVLEQIRAAWEEFSDGEALSRR